MYSSHHRVRRSFRCVYSPLDGGTVATTEHRGRDEEIGPAYQVLTGWVAEHGYEIVGPPRELYLNDPMTVQADEIRTRIEFPVRPLSA